MKKLMMFALLVIVAVVLNACGGADKPEQVAEKYLKALYKGDSTEVYNYATDESMFYVAAGLAAIKQQGFKDVKIENMKCEENGDKAKCTFTEDGSPSSLDLVKKDGKWLVDMKKETQEPTDQMDTEMKDQPEGGEQPAEGGEQPKDDGNRPGADKK